jgi:hypothetical protein
MAKITITGGAGVLWSTIKEYLNSMFTEIYSGSIPFRASDSPKVFEIDVSDSATYGKFRLAADDFPGVNPDGRTNNVMNIGYNIAANGAPEKSGKPAARTALESHFQQAGQAAFELHVASFYDNEGSEFRPITTSFFTDGAMANYRQAFTSLGQHKLVISDTTHTNVYLQSTANGSGATDGAFWSINGNSSFNITTNNLQVHKQRNAADTAFIALPYIDSSDRLNIPGSVYLPGTVLFNGDLYSASFANDSIFKTTVILGSAQGGRIGVGSFAMKSTYNVGWSSTAFAYDTLDTNIGRKAAGVVCIGTGSQGSDAGKLQANNVILSPGASVTPASNGQMTFELTSNTSLTVKVKGSDGTVRSAVLTLT